jgi:hypothetical protein
MLRCVALVRTDVSEEPSASFIRVTRVGELGTTLAATSYRFTLRRNPKDTILHIRRLENLKSYIIMLCRVVFTEAHVPNNLESNPLLFCSFWGLKHQLLIRIAVKVHILEKLWSRCICHRNNTIQFITVLRFFWENGKTLSSVLEIILSWVQWLSSVTRHTLWLLPCVSAPVKRCLHQLQKIAAALWFPFSTAHRRISRLNFALYDSHLYFWCPSSITTVHDKFRQAALMWRSLFEIRLHKLVDVGPLHGTGMTHRPQT